MGKMKATTVAENKVKKGKKKDSLAKNGQQKEVQYVVERIVARKQLQNGTVQYLVKWKDWSPKHNTWEPEEHLKVDCPSKLKEFQKEEERKAGENGRKPEMKRGDPKGGVYEVEAIVDKRISFAGKVEYEVKWVGWDAEDNTWELAERMAQDCPGVVEAFENGYRELRAIKRSSGGIKRAVNEESSGIESGGAKRVMRSGSCNGSSSGTSGGGQRIATTSKRSNAEIKNGRNVKMNDIGGGGAKREMRSRSCNGSTSGASGEDQRIATTSKRSNVGVKKARNEGDNDIGGGGAKREMRSRSCSGSTSGTNGGDSTSMNGRNCLDGLDGISRNLKPKKIIGTTTVNGVRTFLVEWEGFQEVGKIPSSVMREHHPEIAFTYLEEEFPWNGSGNA